MFPCCAATSAFPVRAVIAVAMAGWGAILCCAGVVGIKKSREILGNARSDLHRAVLWIGYRGCIVYGGYEFLRGLLYLLSAGKSP